MKILLDMIDPLAKKPEHKRIRLLVRIENEILGRKIKKLMNEEKHKEALKLAKEQAQVEQFFFPGMTYNFEMPTYILVE